VVVQVLLQLLKQVVMDLTQLFQLSHLWVAVAVVHQIILTPLLALLVVAVVDLLVVDHHQEVLERLTKDSEVEIAQQMIQALLAVVDLVAQGLIFQAEVTGQTVAMVFHRLLLVRQYLVLEVAVVAV
jgi:hypothetical protein